MNPPERSDPPAPRLPRRRRTLQSRLTIIFAVLSTAALVCCCVPLLVLQFAFGLDETKEPAEILAVAQKIAPLVLPAKFQGTLARSADNSLFEVYVARFDHREGRGRLVIGQMHMKFRPPGFEDQDSKLLQKAIDGLSPGLRLPDVKQTQKRTLKFRGGNITFEIVEGEDRASTTRLKQVSGSFTGPSGAFQLILQAETDYLTDEAIEALLQSLAEE